MHNKRFLIYIFGSIVILTGIYVAVTFNSLVKKDEKMKLQWNEVQNTYQRRLDLVPNLVIVVQGGANFEKTTLQKIAEARAKATNFNVSSDVSAKAYHQQTTTQNELADAANRLIVVVENYPDLKGTRAFIDLQAQLEGTERRIKVARRDFNAALADYNSSVRSFPTNMVARVLGFDPKEGFQSDKGSDEAIEIKF